MLSNENESDLNDFDRSISLIEKIDNYKVVEKQIG